MGVCYVEVTGGVCGSGPLTSCRRIGRQGRTVWDEPNRRYVTPFDLASGARRRGVNETNKHCGAGLLPQSGRLPMGLPGPHARSRIHPIDRGRPLRRRLHDQLAVQRVPRNPRPHLRPALRAGLPARPGREGPGRDLPLEARRRRLQGRHPRPPAAAGGAEERQAHRARRRRARLAHGGARPCARSAISAPCSTRTPRPAA